MAYILFIVQPLTRRTYMRLCYSSVCDVFFFFLLTREFSDHVQHPFVTGDYQEPRSVIRTSVMVCIIALTVISSTTLSFCSIIIFSNGFKQEAGNQMATPGTNPKSL